MKRDSGQNLIEFSLLGLIVLSGSIFGVLFFSQHISPIFDNDNIAVFNKERTNQIMTDADYISSVKFNINESSFNSPLEVVLEKSLTGAYTDTSGSSSEITKTLDVISEYIEQLDLLVDSIEFGTVESDSLANLKIILENYETAISDYVALDGKTANEQMQHLVQYLDLTVDLAEGGNLASSLDTSLTQVVEALPDGNVKNMIDLYGDSVLNLGKSLDYAIDSRLKEKLVSYATEIAPLEFVGYSATPDDNCLYNIKTISFDGHEMNERSGQIKINENGQFYVTDLNGDPVIFVQDPNNPKEYTVSDVKLNSYSSKDIKIKFNEDKPTEFEIKVKGKSTEKVSIPTDYVSESKFPEDLNTVEGLTNILDSLAQSTSNDEFVLDVIKEIDVYRKGNFNEILPDSYNAATICAQISGSQAIEGICNIQ